MAQKEGPQRDDDRVSIDERLSELGIELPPPPSPAANYVTFVEAGGLAYTSGHGPFRPDGSIVMGRVPDSCSIEDAYAAARLTTLSLLATLRAQLGSLERVERVVKVLGLVNSTPEFTAHPSVIDGCSDLLVEVFGERGRHARSAVGVASLPFGIPVEIELIVAVN